MDETTRQLHQFAHTCGLLTDYHDVFGNHVICPNEAIVAVLRALGYPARSPDDLNDARQFAIAQRQAQVLPPVLVAWIDRPFSIEIRLPRQQDDARAVFDLQLESGDSMHHRIDLNDAPIIDSESTRGERYVARRFDWPESIPAGYHSLTLDIGGRVHQSLVIAAPPQAFQGKDAPRPQWGLFAPVYALKSKRNWGAGDYTDLETLSTFTAGLGGGIVGTLPLLPMQVNGLGTPSPYAPVSRLFWNEFFLDVTRLPGVVECREAQAILDADDFRAELVQLKSAPFCEYKRGMALKRRVLEPLARAFFASGGDRSDEFVRFCATHPQLDEYAAFRAVCDRRHESWLFWSQTARDGSLAAGDFDIADKHYHMYVQWRADQQLASVAASARRNGPGLYLDYPVGVHPDGYDTWRERSLFVNGMSVGAPPDTFFIKGQDWGFWPVHPKHSRASGHRYFIASIRHHLQHAGALRIDHVMGLHRSFWIPNGMPATAGVYVQQPAEDYYAILCLESHRHACMIVGEDLGTVPDVVRAWMTRHGLKRSYVAQFDMHADPEKALGTVEPGAVATVNTHDTATFAGFWDGCDIDNRVELGLMTEIEAAAERAGRANLRHMVSRFLAHSGDTQPGADKTAILRGVLRHMCKQKPDIALINLEDLWLERHQQNVPGTVTERPNWKRRLRYPLESLASMPHVMDTLRDIASIYGKRDIMIDSRSSAVKDTNTDTTPGTVRHGDSYLTDHDVYLFNEGTNYRLYDRLGSHVRTIDGVSGVNFAVWAPDAERVYVMGDFNGWNSTSHPLAPRGSSGIWEGFIPGVQSGSNYKYYIHSRYDGYRVQKADPFAFRFETPPKSASMVWDLDYEWGDHEWMRERHRRNALDAPISIYEVHLGSWMRSPDNPDQALSYRDLAPRLAEHVNKLGFTHVEFLPIMEHPFYGSWGYQTIGYFAPTSRYGDPQDFMYLVDYLHQHGIGVILDWVPSHFPTDEHALGYFDGTHLFEHSDNRLALHPDWNSWIFNYGRNEVRAFLLSSALFWLEKYHADGLRVDAVASMLYLDYSRKAGEWLPNKYGGRENIDAIDFLRQFNSVIYKEFPDVQTIAEESTDWPMVSRPTYVGGLGFGMKWDMGWMHDTLEYMTKDPIHRKFHHNELTFRMLYAFFENFALPLSHDEVVHGKGSLLRKMPGDDWQKFANLRLLFGYMFGQAGKKLLFMGGEFAQWNEWYHETSLDWHLLQFEPHQGMQRWVADLNRAYRDEPALHELDTNPSGFEWVDCNDAQQSTISLIRKDKDGQSEILVVANFTPVPREGYRVGVTRRGYWREILNSDAQDYGGSGIGNGGGVNADDIPFHGRRRPWRSSFGHVVPWGDASNSAILRNCP